MKTNEVTQSMEFINIPIEQINGSETNPRNGFDNSALNELAESIKEKGVLQPIIVRLGETNTNGKHFLLVCGERRLKASKLAGLTEIPAYFKNISDEEAIEMQIIENLQREDVHPLDETKAFQKMADNKMPVKQIALKIGKTELFIKERVALNGLIDEAKTDFRKGIMQLGHAKILCLLLPEQQKRAIEELSYREEKNRYYKTPKDLKDFLNNRVLLRLEDAPFDTESKTLVKKAGACTSCPTQTGVNKELFSCLTSDSMCQNSACWELKVKATTKLQNDKLLKQFKAKKNDCLPLSNSYYSYDDEKVLTVGKWTKAKNFSECPNVTLGFVAEANQVVMVCCNKTCKTHFKQDTYINPEGREVKNRSGIPIDETKAEGLKRRMIKRHEKEKNQDRNTARKQLAEKLLQIEDETLNDHELNKVIEIVAWNMMSENVLNRVAELIGFTKEKSINYWNHNKLTEHIFSLSAKEKYMCLRKMLLLKALDSEIGQDEFYKSSDFHLHVKSFGKSITPVYKQIRKKREKTRKENIKEIKAQIKKAQEKDSKYLTFYTGDPSGYLKEVKNYSVDQLIKQPIEKLKSFAKELGCKLPKEVDTRYYAHTLFERMAYLKNCVGKLNKSKK